PPYPIQTMIKFVLMGSPRGKLSLSEVYEVVTARFPFYVPKPVDSNRPDWQNNVRHSLSTFVCFVQEEREIDDPGKGQYWT
ncbi:winged helix DNA-binding domain-containing protein, partial [Clavulina sp. PMI_390]